MTLGGGVASRTGPPACCGTCSCSLLGFRVGVGGGNAVDAFTNGEFGLALLGVGGAPIPVAEDGEPFAGKVENGPSCIVRLLGGLPRSFPVDDDVELGQAAETEGP